MPLWHYKMRAVESTNELDWDSANTTFKGNASTNIPAAEAGTYTLTIDLNDPAKFTYTIVKQ